MDQPLMVRKLDRQKPTVLAQFQCTMKSIRGMRSGGRSSDLIRPRNPLHFYLPERSVGKMAAFLAAPHQAMSSNSSSPHWRSASRDVAICADDAARANGTSVSPPRPAPPRSLLSALNIGPGSRSGRTPSGGFVPLISLPRDVNSASCGAYTVTNNSPKARTVACLAAIAEYSLGVSGGMISGSIFFGSGILFSFDPRQLPTPQLVP